MTKYYAVPSQFDGDQYDRQDFIEQHGVSSYALDWAIISESGEVIAATGKAQISAKLPTEIFAMSEEEKNEVICNHFAGKKFFLGHCHY